MVAMTFDDFIKNYLSVSFTRMEVIALTVVSNVEGSWLILFINEIGKYDLRACSVWTHFAVYKGFGHVTE